MTRHYRCDVCGEEMNSRASGISEATWLSGEQNTVKVSVRIGPPARENNDEPLDLCSLCFRKSVARVIGATLLTNA